MNGASWPRLILTPYLSPMEKNFLEMVATRTWSFLILNSRERKLPSILNVPYFDLTENFLPPMKLSFRLEFHWNFSSRIYSLVYLMSAMTLSFWRISYLAKPSGLRMCLTKINKSINNGFPKLLTCIELLLATNVS